jgi:hypothetical protein
MISRHRLVQIAAVIALTVVHLMDRPSTAAAAENCSFCIESCNVDLEEACEARACGHNSPSCYISGGCPGSMGSAVVVCMPI